MSSDNMFAFKKSMNCPHCDALISETSNIHDMNINEQGNIACPKCQNTIILSNNNPPPVDTNIVQNNERPTSITVFGILGCIFGGLSLICSPFNLFGIVNAPSSSSIKGVLFVMALANLISGGMLLAGGIGLLKQKAWAPKVNIYYVYMTLVIVLINTILILSGITIASYNVEVTNIFKFAAISGFIINLAYLATLYIYMKKPHVIAACKNP